MPRFRTYFLLFGLLFTVSAKSQTLDKGEWESLKKEVEYKRYASKPAPKQEFGEQRGESSPPPARSGGPLNLGPVMQIILVLGFGILILILIYNIVKNMVFRSKNENLAEADLENDLNRSELTKSDLEKWLDQAMADKDHRLVIRIYFLMALRKMERMNLIVWEKDKTNWQYLRELGDHKLRPSFQLLIQEYDVLWYGEKDFDESQLQNKVEQFKGFGRELEIE